MKKKILIILLILIFLYCIGGVIYSVIVRQKKEVVETSSILTIDKYDYKFDYLKETTLYKQEFNNLKSNLESEEIDLKNYASSIAKLYIIDLYTLSTKSNKYDITSDQYVHINNRDNYKLKVSETLYKYIEDNSNGRSQNLPEVSEVILKDIVESTYIIGSNEYPCYNVNISWFYKKDLGYDTSATLTLINDNSIISVVEEKRIEDLEQKNS